jgi:hypothetical protein
MNNRTLKHIGRPKTKAKGMLFKFKPECARFLRREANRKDMKMVRYLEVLIEDQMKTKRDTAKASSPHAQVLHLEDAFTKSEMIHLLNMMAHLLQKPTDNFL